MEETTSVFWVDLGYRLRSRKRVSVQGSRGVTGTSSYSCSCYTCSWGSASGVWVVVSGMYGTHLKHGQCLQLISSN